MATKREGVPCYDKAELDEPVFVLRAQDVLAEELVREWARRAAARGASTEKYSSAWAVADAMAEWPTKKTPD